MDEHALKVGLEEKVAAVKERWWRSLAQLERADVGGEREFAEGETESALAGFDRRSFLKLMGASIALAGAGGTAGCSKPQPVEKIVPYVNQPEGMVAGVARYYASAIPIHGWGRGVVVEQHEGRPTKIEGNPDHPSSVGGTDIFMQAAILELYDPDRATGVTNGGQTTTWSNFVGVLGRFVEERGGAKKVRVRVLSGTVTSPTVARQMEEMRAIFPGMVWHQHDPVGRANTNEGIVQAFGQALTAVYDFKKATCVLSLDAHFLGDEPGAVRYSREFAHRRRMAFKRFGPTGSLMEGDGAVGRESISRLYVAESAVTFTGARADHRLPLKARDIARVAALVADAGVAVKCPEAVRAWAKAAGDDLRQAGKNALVVVGENQPAEVHALGHALNASLGAIGNTVRYIERIEAGPVGGVDSSLASLTEAMDRGEVDLLVVLDSNPVFDAPGDVHFSDALRRFLLRRDRLAVSLAAHEDETAELCRWVIPLSHALEAWGDCRGHDGTASVIQPLIEPLYESKSVVEFLAAVMAAREGQRVGQLGEGYDLVRRHWFGAWGDVAEAEKELRWRKSLHRGTVPDSAFADVQVALKGSLQTAIAKVVSLIGEEEGRIELNIRPDPSIHAGEWANNPWLQELPKPLTRLTWDNAAIVSPATAVRLKLEGGAEGNHESRARQAMIRVSIEGRTCELPVWVQPGQPEDAITVYLGGGRWRGGRVQEGVGFNVYPLRSSGNLWQNSEVKVEAINRTYPLACTQNHQVMDGRDIVRERAITQLRGVNAAPTSPDLYSSQNDKEGSTVHLSLYDEYKYEGYKWGMVIDLSACIGCNACVVACQAENNIPVVGKEQVLRGREMHWIRIDAYYGSQETTMLAEAGANPKMMFQPMLCQHCEDAPCEVVCPVEATSHSDEGLNEMTYNRCVGTRYCSNNCPYKVRRFNFFQYNDHDQPTLDMQKNPNVTVRSRGVMEKCSYCVQRINKARIEGKREWARNDAMDRSTEFRTVEDDGWVKPERLPRLRVITACQQACPAEAIVFGDINDTQSLVHLLKNKLPWAGINYGVLTELNTQPRTSYLERLTNVNPVLAGWRRGGA